MKRPVAVVAFLMLAASTAAGSVVPFDVQMPLVLKALTYDRSLKSRATDQVRIVILSSSRISRDVTDDLQASLDALPDRTVNGMPVSFRDVTFSDEASVEQALRTGRWAAVYVLPGFREDELAAIRRVSAARQVLAVAAEAGDVEKGLAFGIGAHGGRPQIVVNLPSAKACGSDFDLALLRLSRVIQ